MTGAIGSYLLTDWQLTGLGCCNAADSAAPSTVTIHQHTYVIDKC